MVHAHAKDYFVRRDGRAYERSDYYAHPDEYVSEFHTKIAPYLSLLLHGAGWAPAFPRLMTNEQLTTTLEIAQTLGKGRFACVGDISCDVSVREQRAYKGSLPDDACRADWSSCPGTRRCPHHTTPHGRPRSQRICPP